MAQTAVYNLLFGAPVVIAIGIGVFFLLREFWCWYLKLNRIERLLEQIEENTRPVKVEVVPEPEIVEAEPQEPEVESHVMTEEEILARNIERKLLAKKVLRGLAIVALIAIIIFSIIYIIKLL